MDYTFVKKIVSTCLLLLLILGICPSVLATTSAIPVKVTGTTLVEGEDYPDNSQGTLSGAAATITKEVKSNSSASGGEYLFTDNYGTGSGKTHYWEIDFKIPANGTYTIKTRVGKPWRYRFQSLNVIFGETTMANITAWNDTTTGNSVEWGEYETELTLTAGTYTFKVETGEGTGGNHHLYIDYVSVTTEEITPSVISVGENGTTIEIEDYPVIKRSLGGTVSTVGGDIISNSVFSNNYYFSYDEEISGGQRAIWEQKVDLSTAGEYNLEYYIRRNAASGGELSLLIDGAEIYSIGEGKQGWERIRMTQCLTAGEHTFSIQSYSGDVNAQIFADYIKLTPKTRASIEAQRYEFENYAGTYSEVAEIEGTSGGKVVSGNTQTDHSYKIPVTISESRYYDVLYAVNKKTSGNNESKIKFSLNLESDFPLPFTNETHEGTDLDYSGTDYPMALYEYKGVWIDKEDYILETKFEKNARGLLSYQLDYIEIRPSEPPEITQSSVSKIEFETYAGAGVYDWDRGVTEVDGTSEGKVVFNDWSDIDPSWSFPVKVKDSGFYHINYVAGDCSASWLSKISFKLGKVLLGTNDADYIEDYGTIVWASQNLCKYSTEWIWLDEGEYNLSVEVSPELIDNVYKYQADYIEFVPAVNGISMEDGVVKVHAAYTDVTSGKVLMALYNGSKLVGTTTYNLSDETYVDFEYIPEETVTKVKVFIWNDDNTATPKEMSKDFYLN